MNNILFLDINSSMTRMLFRISLLLFALWISKSLMSQSQTLRFAFYNVENFFDLDYDSTRTYNAFTPEGEQRWTPGRYFAKRNNIFKTIVAMGEGELPAMVGFCEVENEKVLLELVNRTPLRQGSYKAVHYESEDRRGIDVALIYRSNVLKLLYSYPVKVTDPADANFKTRDILFASFEADGADTVHVYINHWPSRFGGQLESVERRMLAALCLRRHVDSMLMVNPFAKLIILGDMNDTPEDESLTLGLRAFPPSKVKKEDDLVHLFTNANELGHSGTLKHLHSWQIFDHIIVSQGLYNSGRGLRYRPGSARIFAAPFLLTEDERYLGTKLFRTYSGPTYLGGFADHLPVFIDLEWVSTP